MFFLPKGCEYMPSIIQRIYQLLEAKGLSATSLANHLGLRQSTVSGWKLRDKNPPSELIVPIANYLDVSPYLLLTGKESPFTSSRLANDEQELLSYYRKTSVEGKTMILLAAIREVERANK